MAAVGVLALARQQARVLAGEAFAHPCLLAAQLLGESWADRQEAFAGELVVEVAQVGCAGGVGREAVQRQAARVDRAQPGLDQDQHERAHAQVREPVERVVVLEPGDDLLLQEARRAVRCSWRASSRG